jgi:hypothetical protein
MKYVTYVPMNCCAHRRSFIVEAQGRLPIFGKSSLLLIFNHTLPAGALVIRPRSSFRYETVDAASRWGCPYCGAFNTRNSGGARLFWQCDSCRGLNCVGRDRFGFFRCACGHVASGFSHGRPEVPEALSFEALEVTYAALVLAR